MSGRSHRRNTSREMASFIWTFLQFPYATLHYFSRWQTRTLWDTGSPPSLYFLWCVHLHKKKTTTANDRHERGHFCDLQLLAWTNTSARRMYVYGCSPGPFYSCYSDIIVAGGNEAVIAGFGCHCAKKVLRRCDTPMCWMCFDTLMCRMCSLLVVNFHKTLINNLLITSYSTRVQEILLQQNNNSKNCDSSCTLLLETPANLSPSPTVSLHRIFFILAKKTLISGSPNSGAWWIIIKVLSLPLYGPLPFSFPWKSKALPHFPVLLRFKTNTKFVFAWPASEVLAHATR